LHPHRFSDASAFAILEILQQVVDEFFSGGGLFLFDSVDESDSLNDVG
jgi:hypothetical protein